MNLYIFYFFVCKDKHAYLCAVTVMVIAEKETVMEVVSVVVMDLVTEVMDNY